MADIVLGDELIKLVVFDVAGTIIEDHGEVLSAFRLALQQSGIGFADTWRGASKREVIRHFVEGQFVRSGTPLETSELHPNEVADHMYATGLASQAFPDWQYNRI